MTNSLFQFLYRWLIESDLPWGLQVFWKLLAFALAGLLVYANTTWEQPPSGVVRGLLYAFAGFFILLGLFSKLGDG